MLYSILAIACEPLCYVAQAMMALVDQWRPDSSRVCDNTGSITTSMVSQGHGEVSVINERSIVEL